MKRGAASSLLAALLVLLLALPVLAWTVTHRDADDFEIAPDIHKATKRVFVVARGAMAVPDQGRGRAGTRLPAACAARHPRHDRTRTS